MGAGFSRCCSGENSKADDRIVAPGMPVTIGPEELAEFRSKLEQGIVVQISLGQAERLICDLHYACKVGSLYLSCKMQGERRVRPLPLTSISSLLHTYAEVDALESAAGVKPDDHCVALYLESAGGCLPLFFPDNYHRELFVEFIKVETKNLQTKNLKTKNLQKENYKMWFDPDDDEK